MHANARQCTPMHIDEFLFQESTGLILTHSVILGVSFFLQLIGAVVICVYGVEESPGKC